MLEYSPIKKLQLGFLSEFVGEQYMETLKARLQNWTAISSLT
ncbi:MAG TPA: hypothetical protein PLV43_07685 [Aequorivita sp.]|nr:hypothetical protein [Aequorivita sp.]